MKKSGHINHDLINQIQILTGTTALFLGILVYLVDRSLNQTSFVGKNITNIISCHILLNLYGIIGKSLPDIFRPAQNKLLSFESERHEF